MGIPRTLIRESRWRKEFKKRFREGLLEMVAPFTLEDLYPEIDEEVDGQYTQVRRILPHQKRFHDGISLCGREANVVAFGGAYGSGKSVSGTVNINYLCRKFPGLKVVVVCPYDYYFDESVWPTWEKIAPFEDMKLYDHVNRKNRELFYNNGSYVRFKAYDDAAKVKGWEAHIIWIEEASELGDGQSQKAKEVFDALLGRLRAGGENFPKKIFITFNPKGHNWLWKLFIKDSPQCNAPVVTWIERPNENPANPLGNWFNEYECVKSNGDVYYCITAPSTANTELPDGYVARMVESYDPDTLRRFVMGDFNSMAQNVYDRPYYDPKTHVISYESFLEYWDLDDTDEREIPRYWKLFVGIDVGGPKSPWACEFYVETPSGEYVCIHEIYVSGVTWDYVANEILNFTVGPLLDPTGPVNGERDTLWSWDNVSYFIDPKSGPRKEGVNQTAIMEEFEDFGIHCEIPKSYHVNAGVAHVKRFLLPDRYEECPYLPDYQDEETEKWERGHARLYYIADRCPMNIKEKEVWRYMTKKPREQSEAEEGLSKPFQEKPVDVDDHAQTAEIFALIGASPLDVTRRRRIRDELKPVITYPGQKRRR